MFRDKLNSQTDSWSKGKFGPDYKKFKTGLSWGTPGISWLAFQRGGGAPKIWLKHHTLVQVVHEAQQPVFNIVVAQLPRTGTHLSKYTARFLPLTPSPERRWRTLGAMREPVLQSSFFSLSVQIAAYQLGSSGPVYCTTWNHFESKVSHSINLLFTNFSHWACQRTCLGLFISWWSLGA